MPFDVKNYPRSDGVYVIATWSRTKEETRACYVGQGNIRDRFEAHKRSDEPNECLANVMGDKVLKKVFFTIIDDKKQRNDIEHTLYMRYNSTPGFCNDNIPSGNWTSINFPF